MDRVCRTCRGVTLIEVLTAMAIVGVLASIAVPALMSTRRHANEMSAIASLRAIADAQHAFTAACAHGAFASRLSQLAAPATGGSEGFLAPDLARRDRVVKSGYLITLARGGDGQPAAVDACNGVPAADLTTSFFATAAPEAPGSGTLYFWVGVTGTIFQSPHPIVSTAGQANPAGAEPAGNQAGRPGRRRTSEAPHLDVP
jgi:prepilin-type N-terminal cleavage/methylation domain-containing protein